VNAYLISLGCGLLVGLAYTLVKVPAPAPPLIALVGLLGMLAGEQIIPLVKHLFVPPAHVVRHGESHRDAPQAHDDR
jgi:XapX domain-containing protein